VTVTPPQAGGAPGLPAALAEVVSDFQDMAGQDKLKLLLESRSSSVRLSSIAPSGTGTGYRGGSA